MALQKSSTSNNNKRRHRRMRHKPLSRDDPTPSICAHCGSNLWCNQRVVKLVMTLKCCVCGENKKLNKNDVWYEWKCVEFHKTSSCSMGEECPKMHIYYSKILAEKAMGGSLPGSDSQAASCQYESTGCDTASCVSGQAAAAVTDTEITESDAVTYSPYCHASDHESQVPFVPTGCYLDDSVNPLPQSVQPTTPCDWYEGSNPAACFALNGDESPSATDLSESAPIPEHYVRCPYSYTAVTEAASTTADDDEQDVCSELTDELSMLLIAFN
eukprot:TRINITY_DN7513_c5_g1_i1.p1 TRINITY_DN7513_c5_g1~~TRINITY_DN7513_c5_g1_i1.p1  ORF type:complete len:294 (+),score=56.05 TRINITY_DN7513_c5_g1_i1:72-884(+)